MPYRHRRMCPICFKPHLLSLSNHLGQVHGLSSEDRQPWLKRALRSPLPLDQYPVHLPPSNYPVITIPSNNSFKKPHRRRRICPICGKQSVLKLSNHLSQVHGLSSEERQRWLQRASHLPPQVDLPIGRVENPVNLSPNSCPLHQTVVTSVQQADVTPMPLATQPYPEFAFQHPYSMMVVGPSQCGKTHFVHRLLMHKCITYPDQKPVMVCWFYNQWQPRYEELQRALQSQIRFARGLPELEDDLSTIQSTRHTIIVLDDLMAEAKDSPVVSKLFTQGRHRNASVILLLQNMFPKGKYNTDISRNATYKVLFRSPGDRKQIDIMAEQTFAKDRPRFMQAYHRETDRPYGYILLDNHPRTVSARQVVGNVFGGCYSYPNILASLTLQVRQSRPQREPVQRGTSWKRQAPEVQITDKRQALQQSETVQSTVKRHSRLHYEPGETDSEDEGSMTSGGPKQAVDLIVTEGGPGESVHERVVRIVTPSDEDGHYRWTPRGIWS